MKLSEDDTFIPGGKAQGFHIVDQKKKGREDGHKSLDLIIACVKMSLRTILPDLAG